MAREDGEVSVTELAKMGKCETMLVLDRRIGRAAPDAVERRAREGTAAHARFENEMKGDSRCFVASWALGPDADETIALRRWRDEVLNVTAAGRRLVELYYAVSPCLIRVASWIPGARPLCAAALRMAARLTSGKGA